MTLSLENMLSCFSPAVRELPRFSSLAEAVLRQAADLAAAAESLSAAFSLSSAVGAQLDILGEGLGISRRDAGAASDGDYRAALRASLARWRWDGTNAGLPDVLREAFPEAPPALRDNLDGSVTASGAPPGAASLLPVPAGVRLLREESLSVSP